MACELCDGPGGEILWQGDELRVVRVVDPDYPAFCRVIWQRHVKEMTDLSPTERNSFMAVVFAVEAALRRVLTPDKINLASLGNQTPHLHWHVIPRWSHDRHFPHPVWAAAQRERGPTGEIEALLPKLRAAIEQSLSALPR
jgi:diadenosine tetraphosphate (Ap4A) HIT family hydrolase